MVGNFVKGRNQMMVCEALALLHDAGVDFQFQFVGARSEATPGLYDRCVAYCESHGMSGKVAFLGSRSDVPALLARWDGFVYGSDHDTFGIAVIEAIASGLPTFVNDWTVMQEVTQDGALAWLFPTGDAEALCDLLQVFIQSPSSYQAKTLDSAKTVRRIYSIEHHATQLYRLYQMVLNS